MSVIFFHPYFIRSFKTTLIGNLYELSLDSKNKIVLICNDDIKSYFESKKKLFKNDNIHLIYEPILFPKFDLKNLFIQSLKIKNTLDKIVFDFCFDKVILENDCMSFSSMVISNYFNKKKIYIECIQSLAEFEDYSESRNLQYLQYKKSFFLFNKFLMEILRFSFYIIVHYFLFFIALNKVKFMYNSYINSKCFSGIISQCHNKVYEENAFSKFHNLKISNSTIQKVNHPILNNKVPINLFFTKQKINFNLGLLVLVPCEIYDIQKTILKKSFSLIKKFCNKEDISEIYFKPHPDISGDKFKLLIKNDLKDFNLNFINKKDDINSILLKFKNIIQLPPGKSSVLEIFKFISMKYKNDIKSISIDINANFNIK